MKYSVLALCVLLLLAVQLLSAENVPQKRDDDIELDFGDGPNPPTKEEIHGALKRVDQVMKEAIKNVEEVNTKRRRRALGWRVRVRADYDRK